MVEDRSQWPNDERPRGLGQAYQNRSTRPSSIRLSKPSSDIADTCGHPLRVKLLLPISLWRGEDDGYVQEEHRRSNNAFVCGSSVAEYPLGDLPLRLLPALTVLVPAYGGGAILIREAARRMGRGWR